MKKGDKDQESKSGGNRKIKKSERGEEKERGGKRK